MKHNQTNRMKNLWNVVGMALLLCLLVPLASVRGQVYQPNAAVPLDPSVIYGKLDNGFTYYIKENKTPKERAEFYLVENVGAVQEDPDQNGLAHFCEHMAFNGTKHFEKKKLLNYLQSIGMKFGPEINAFTNEDVTNYMLQKVPMADPKHIDTALLILYDWASSVSFEDSEIDLERGVLHEEWRTSRGAMFRMMRQANKTVYKGSKYADHDVIGDINIIDKAPYDVIKRFYNDWYRPDLQAIVAVGDFDGKALEKKIKELFSPIPARTQEKTKDYFNIPDFTETLIAIEKDPESQYSVAQVYYKHPVPKAKDMSYYRKKIVENLYNTMLNARLQELTQAENPPFIYAMTYNGDLVRTKTAYVAFAVSNAGKLADAMKGVLVENERVKRHGFTATEFERGKQNLMSMIEKQYAEKDKQESDSYTWQYFSHFLTGEPTPGIEFDYAFMKELLPGITLEEVDQLAKELVSDENRVVVMMSPEKADIAIPTEPEVTAILAGLPAEKIDPYVDKVTDQPLVADIPLPGRIDKKSKNKDLGTVQWTFENGVKVVMKTTDFKEDEILMAAYSLGGTSLYDVKDLVSADLTSNVATESGIDGFDKFALQKKLAGKIADVSPELGNTSEGFSGSCAPKDLETMLQLVYLYFTESRIDKTAFDSFISRMQGILQNKSADPSSALWDSVTVILASHNPRVRPMTSELLNEASLSRIKYIFKDRFGDPGSFTFYLVGNIKPDDAKPLLEKYLGGLPSVHRTESWKDDGVRPPAGKIEKTITRPMQVPKSTVFISYTGTFDYDDFKNRLDLTALCDILDVRYTETIREEEGGTYGVAIYPTMEKYPYENYQVTIYFDCDPANVNKLKGIAYAEIEKLKTEGPVEKDLNGVIENDIKSHQEGLRQNPFWLNKLKSHDFYKIDYTDLFDFDKYVHNLTKESLKSAANTFFTGNVVEIILNPENVSDNVKNPVIK
jgi:zinc protease